MRPATHAASAKIGDDVDVALDAVRLASALCQEVQAQLMRMDEQAETKDDRSLVTLADYAAQAVIAWCV